MNTILESPTNSSTKNDDDDFEEDDDDEDDDSVETPKPKATSESPKLLAAKNSLTKTVNIKINKLVVKDHNEVFNIKDEILTEEEVGSTITEDSSGSSYVSAAFLQT